MKPSIFYRGELWRIGLGAARLFPTRFLEKTAEFLVQAYGAICGARREVVIRNIMPAVQFDRSQAEKIASRLFRNFGIKLADLWRYESGRSVDNLFKTNDDFDFLHKARNPEKGILLLTPHIGNWEFGAVLLRKHGIPLQVITQAEPQASFTRLRQRSRARWGIETLVIGQDPFAFVEVIRRLEAGAIVALLVDRPPSASAVAVKLFGHPFAASIAPAELARATGCRLLPVYLPREDRGYSVRILPEIQYDRRALGNRESRANLTQEILGQFEPIIYQHLDQWYHFVPLWQHEGLL